MATPGVWIRVAGPEDAALVADVSRRTFYDTFARYNTEENMRMYLDEQFPRARQMAEVGAPGRVFLLAFYGDEPAGYASLRLGEPPHGLEGEHAIEIVQLYSEQKMIGKGVGPALMRTCIDTARQEGCDWIWLGVWERNERAKAFYTKWGFEPFGKHVFFVGLDAQTDWWMRRRL